MAGWQLVVVFNFVTAASYVGIAYFIVRGLIRTHQLFTNRLALATATIFVTCAAHHILHALDLFAEGDAMHISMMREMMGQSIDVVVTASTAVTGVLYLSLRHSYSRLLRSPAMFDHAEEIRYRQLAANLPHTAVFVFDTDLRYVLAGGVDTESVGYERSALEGRIIPEVLPPHIWSEIGDHYAKALDGVVGEFDHTSSVTGVVFHNRIGPMLDERGRIIGGLVVAEDVSAERRMQQELHDAQAFNVAVLAASPDITVISALPGGQLTWASRSVLELLGWPPDANLADEVPG